MSVIPPAIEEAFHHLEASGMVTLLGPPEKCLGDAYALDFEISVPQPNPARLPARVQFRAVMTSLFPAIEATIYLVDRAEWRFPHLDLRDGKLCLKIDRRSSWDPSVSISESIQDTKAWLSDAAHGLLLKHSEPWELPDFRLNRDALSPKRGAKPHLGLPVWSLEDRDSYAAWQDKVGQVGEVVLAPSITDLGVVPLQFLDQGGQEIPAPKPRSSFVKSANRIHGTWVLLPTLIFDTHRPPRTFSELAELFEVGGISLWALLAKVAGQRPTDGIHYILVGTPVPSKVGWEPEELHWQPIVLPRSLLRSGKKAGKEPAGEVMLRVALGGRLVPWGSTDNISKIRMGARGHLDASTVPKKLCVIGCGALGSRLITALARGGVHDLGIFDPEQFEPDNQCRHVLPPTAVYQNKAKSLAFWLRGMYAHCVVQSFDAPIPIPEDSTYQNHWTALSEADAIIDCTANTRVFEWLSRLGRDRDIRIVHMFTNPHAKMLTICSSGRHATCVKVCNALFDDIHAGRAAFSWDTYNPLVEEVPLGAGCWHPTFPALECHLSTLVTASIPVLELVVGGSWLSRGSGVILRRNELLKDEGGISLAPLVEVVWASSYR